MSMSDCTDGSGLQQ